MTIRDNAVEKVALTMEADTGEYDGFDFHGSIAIAPYAVLILSQEG